MEYDMVNHKARQSLPELVTAYGPFTVTYALSIFDNFRPI